MFNSSHSIFSFSFFTISFISSNDEASFVFSLRFNVLAFTGYLGAAETVVESSVELFPALTLAIKILHYQSPRHQIIKGRDKGFYSKTEVVIGSLDVTHWVRILV